MRLLAHLVDGIIRILDHIKFNECAFGLRLGNLVQGGLKFGREDPAGVERVRRDPAAPSE